MKLFIFVTCLVELIICSREPPQISFEALETLLNLDANVTIASLQENATPIYRKDLHSKYVAYWEIVINNEEFVILSSGPQTGDYRMAFEGSLPTYTSELQKYSKNRCAKYFMDNTAVTMACEGKRGKVLASTKMNSDIMSNTKADSNLFGNASINGTTRSGIFSNNVTKLKKILNVPKISKQLVFVDENSTKTFQKRAKESIWFSLFSSDTYMFLYSGETVRLPFQDLGLLFSVEEGNQDELCAIIGLCNPNKTTAVDNSTLKTTTYGLKHIEFLSDKLLNADKDVSFQIMIRWRKRAIVRRYHFDQVTLKMASSWSYKSIPDRNLFPDYDQFDHGRCPVGCGPVAWASVFGYLDRRAHIYGYNTHSTKLYQNGSDGWTGSDSQVAPLLNDARMIKYISKLHDTLKTFCFLVIGGATWVADMYRVQRLYAAKIPGGKIDVHACWVTSLFASYRTIYRDYVINYINQGFPAIIGWKADGSFLSQHYPMVTAYRVRTKKVKNCNSIRFWQNCKDVQEKEYQFYLHLGWGGIGNGWYPAEAFMAAAATYPSR